MPFVDVIRQKDNSLNAKNLLFLGDGFAATDRDLFDWTVEEIADRLFRFIKPFDLPGVADKVNIFSAFTPSPSSGISCSSPIIEPPAPRAGETDPSGTGRLVDKPSALGLTYAGGTLIESKPGTELLIVEVIASLTHPFEGIDATAVPDCWGANGKDLGLVVVLINDDVGGGTALSYSPSGSANHVWYAAAVTIGSAPGVGFHLAFDFSLPPHVYDHTPLVATWPRNRIPFNQITDVVAHELAHSHFKLDDEYVDDPFDPDAGTGSYKGPPEVPNITSDSDARDAVGNYTNVKWKAEMLPDVRTYVETVGPLRRENQCGSYVPGQVVENSDVQAPAPPQFKKLIRLPSRIIGLYEGADHQPCGVFRPAGTCKMRQTSYREEDTRNYVSAGFCYVCKKAIIGAIDPALVPALRARDYPR